LLRVLRHGWPVLVLLVNLASGADEAYQAGIEKWRQDFDADVRTGGWLTLIGRFQVAQGVGDDFYLLISDEQNPAIHDFKGTTWFPIDPSYKVSAAFTAYAQPETVRVPMTRVDSKILLSSEGDVAFQLAGKTVRLKSFTDSEGLFVMFQDQSNGKESYGGGRYLHAELPKNGVTVLDFNKAFNPYCSVNAYVMCPISPPENRLEFSVPVVESYSAHE
jgi:uncharacterized protein (DUF1684 family)